MYSLLWNILPAGLTLSGQLGTIIQTAREKSICLTPLVPLIKTTVEWLHGCLHFTECYNSVGPSLNLMIRMLCDLFCDFESHSFNFVVCAASIFAKWNEFFNKPKKICKKNNKHQCFHMDASLSWYDCFRKSFLSNIYGHLYCTAVLVYLEWNLV